MSDGSVGSEQRKWPLGWMPSFLLQLRTNGNLRRACETAGISRNAAQKARRDFPAFREAWDEAFSDAVDQLEDEAWRRAKESSDQLLWNLLKSLRRQRYGDKIEIEINVKRKIEALAARHGLSVEEVLAEAEAILAGIEVQDEVEVS